MKFASAPQILLAFGLIIFTQHASLASDSNTEYVLVPGDVLSTRDNDGTVSTMPVLPDGTAVISYAGTIEAAGKTITDINCLVNERAKKWFTSPHIEVTLDHSGTFRVYVLGEVVRSGLYLPDELDAKSPSANSTTKQPFTISKILEMAGGCKDAADINHIHITRLHPKLVIDVSLWKLLLDGDVAEDLVLQSGDVIYVPAAATTSGIAQSSGKLSNSAKRIRVMRAVKNPCLIVVSEDGIDLWEAISRAGGFSDDHSKPHILVTHISDEGRVITERIVVDTKAKFSDRRLKAGDIVMVKTKTINAVKFTASAPKVLGLPPMFIGDFDSPRMLRIKGDKKSD